MSLAEVLEATADLPFAESLPSVVAALRAQPIVVPLAAKPEAGSQTLHLLFANDKDGRAWAYVYSSEAALAEAGVSAPFAIQMPFGQLLLLLDGPGYGGVMIDGHRPRGMCLIPAAYFDDVATQLNA